MKEQRKHLMDCFFSIATAYTFITSNSELISTSIATVQSLAKGLGKEFTIEDLIHCSIISPELIELEQSNSIKLVMPIKKRKRKKLDRIKEMTADLVNVFTKDLDLFIQKHGEGFMNALQSKVEEPIAPQTESMEPKTVNEIAKEFKSDPEYRKRISTDGLMTVQGRESQYSTHITALPENIQKALEKKGLEKLYTHQGLALNAIEQQRNVTISTSTSSGKSLIYQLSILKEIHLNPNATALLLFPTKALSQDQKSRFQRLADECQIECRVETFDGDTPFQLREMIRNSANVILTNPDMLHVTILPNHESWKHFFKNCKFVMVDEIHYYTGQFGAHVRHVLMRLQRIAWYYGTKFQFIGCSATIDNDAHHSSRLFGVDEIMCIDTDGSPTAQKHFCVWKPPFRNEKTLHPISVYEEAAKAVSLLLRNQIRTIVFAKSRKQCEIVYKEIQEMLQNEKDVRNKVKAYRGGYSVVERRMIERKLFEGELLAVVTTNALELGVDIGSLDAVIHVGFPTSLSSYIQQSGRVGRRGNESLDILIVDPDSLCDLQYLENPKLLLDQSKLPPIDIDLDDEGILAIHVNCAAYELPANETDPFLFGDESMYDNASHEFLRFDNARNRFIPLEKFNDRPSLANPIRTIEDDCYEIIDLSRGGTLEEIPVSRAPFTLYPSI